MTDKITFNDKGMFKHGILKYKPQFMVFNDSQ